MAHVYATAGSRLFIGPALAFNDIPLVLGDFEAEGQSPDPWIEVTGLQNVGALGDNAPLIDVTHLNSNRTRKMKGVRNAGSMAVVMSLDPADPGQLAIIAAEQSHLSRQFMLVFNDAPVGGTPSKRLFVGLVMSASEELNEANSVMALNATIEIDSNIVRVNAAA